jgi:hypothetical protein
MPASTVFVCHDQACAHDDQGPREAQDPTSSHEAQDREAVYLTLRPPAERLRLIRSINVHSSRSGAQIGEACIKHVLNPAIERETLVRA